MKNIFLKSSALSAAAVPTGSRGADRYQGGMLMPSAPAPNAHRPDHRLRSGAFKNSSFFCTFPQPFHGIFESPATIFDSRFSKDIQENKVIIDSVNYKSTFPLLLQWMCVSIVVTRIINTYLQRYLWILLRLQFTIPRTCLGHL